MAGEGEELIVPNDPRQLTGAAQTSAPPPSMTNRVLFVPHPQSTFRISSPAPSVCPPHSRRPLTHSGTRTVPLRGGSLSLGEEGPGGLQVNHNLK